ncbi:hypothetical protein [Bosea sp. (in: a-proteobacteria)]|uniref:hypothetical protein n=1 Tax=Bosea sp. (in: a-proteobacteria) TaxID=1871050 RepID=UPI003B3A51F0
MGHWEQIGQWNAKERERRAPLPRWRRELARVGGVILLTAAWIAGLAWLTMPLWRG